MPKDKSSSKSSYKSGGGGGYGDSSNYFGFSSGFGTTFSAVTDFEYQIDPQFQVQLKKLQKRDSLSRIKALTELNQMFQTIDIESTEFLQKTSIKSLLSSWEYYYKKLVNDDDRKVRELSSICLGTLGSKVGKNLAPHLKQLMGPWLFSICDQIDNASTNTALQSFETIFPEKKRTDVLLFSHDSSITYLCDNLAETVESLSSGGSKEENEVSTERYERCICNSLLAIDYLIDKCSNSNNNNNNSNDIYEKIFEAQFFNFFSSKSSKIRKTAYRLIMTIVNKVPGFVEKNLKNLSSKILGIFSEKDPSTHLYMWDAIISFLKRYGDRAWQFVDARKHVLPRLWAIMRAGFYGSHELSYPSLLPLLTFIPDSVIGVSDGNIGFFKEFFTNLYQGLPVLESIKQFNIPGSSNTTSNNSSRPTNLLLSSYFECLLYSIKRWGGVSPEINQYLADRLYQSVFEYLNYEPFPFSIQLFNQLLSDTLFKLSILKSTTSNQQQFSIQQFFDHIIQDPIKSIVLQQQQPTPEITTKQLITRESFYYRISALLNSLSNQKEENNQFGYLSETLFKFVCSSLEKQEGNKENLFELVSILVHLDTPISSILKDSNVNQFITESILPSLKSSLSTTPSNPTLVNNIFTIFALLLSKIPSPSSNEFKQSWSSILELFSAKRLEDYQYLVSLIEIVGDLIPNIRTDRSSFFIQHTLFELIETLKTKCLTNLSNLTTSFPSGGFESVAIDISLLTSLINQIAVGRDLVEQSEVAGLLKEDESHVLLKSLQVIQQWYLRLQSPIMKGHQGDSDGLDFAQMEIALSSYFLLVVNSSINKQLYLSNNQSQLIQSLLSKWLGSSNLDGCDESIITRYNALKLFNLIVSGDNLKFVVATGGEEFLIESSSLILNQFLESTSLLNGNNSGLVSIYQLYTTTISKIPKDIQYRIAVSKLDQLFSLLYSSHRNIQKTAYDLLQVYFLDPKTKMVQSLPTSDEDKEVDIVFNHGEFEKILLDFNLWKLLKPIYDQHKKNQESDSDEKDNDSFDIVISGSSDETLAIKDDVTLAKVTGNLMAWNLFLKNYSIQNIQEKTSINTYLNNGSKDRKVSLLLTCLFPNIKKDVTPQIQQFPYPDSSRIVYPDVQKLCAFLFYSIVSHLPSMVRSWWSDDCKSKVSQQVNQYISTYISPHIIKNEIDIVNDFMKTHKGGIDDSNFTVKGATSIKTVTATYEKEDMVISLNLSIPETYPLEVLSVEFSKRVGVSESQWRTWLLSMTSLLLIQDGTVLDACLLWKSSLDKHFQGVEVCPICYSLFHNGTIPKFQCRNCKNKFHAGCIHKWFLTSHKSNCPLCQVEIQ
eukprot:gene4030-5044_t